jgi:hypothetical protein
MDEPTRLRVDCPRCENRGHNDLDEDATLPCPQRGISLLWFGLMSMIKAAELGFHSAGYFNFIDHEKGNHMTPSSKYEASRPNPALKPLSFLIGEWTTVGTHGLVPGTTYHGRTSFEWLEGGAFLMMRSAIDEPDIPSGIAIFGSDDDLGEYFMLYFDERGVSRRHDVSLHDNVLKWWRTAPGFSQRNTLTIENGGRTMVGKGELSKDGVSWEKDLDLTYTRVK